MTTAPQRKTCRPVYRRRLFFLMSDSWLGRQSRGGAEDCGGESCSEIGMEAKAGGTGVKVKALPSRAPRSGSELSGNPSIHVAFSRGTLLVLYSLNFSSGITLHSAPKTPLTTTPIRTHFLPARPGWTALNLILASSGQRLVFLAPRGAGTCLKLASESWHTVSLLLPFNYRVGAGA